MRGGLSVVEAPGSADLGALSFAPIDAPAPDESESAAVELAVEPLLEE